MFSNLIFSNSDIAICIRGTVLCFRVLGVYPYQGEDTEVDIKMGQRYVPCPSQIPRSRRTAGRPCSL